MQSVVLVLLGGVIGAYGTLIGAGGGFLLVPLLLFMDPLSSPSAVTGLSLSIVAANALSGSLAYARKRRIDYHVAIALGLASISGTVIGALLTASIPRRSFEALFGVLMLALALLILWRPVRPATPSAAPLETGVPPTPAPGYLYVGLPASFLVGLVSGAMGIGGSPLQVVVLTHLMHVPVRTAMPTSQFMVLLSTVGGVLAHVFRHEFEPELVTLLSLGAGALVGAQVGAALSEQISGGVLVRLMALALVTVGVRLLWR